MKKILELYLYFYIYIRYFKFKLLNQNNMKPGWHAPYTKNSDKAFVIGQRRLPKLKNVNDINLDKDNSEIYPLK